MIENIKNIFLVIDRFDSSYIERNPETVRIEGLPTADINSEDYENIFKTAKRHSNWIRRLELKWITEGVRSNRSVLSGSDLDVKDHNIDSLLSSVDGIEPNDVSTELHENLESEDYSDALDQIHTLLGESDFSFQLTLDKGCIMEDVVNGQLEHEPILWQDTTSLSAWKGSKSTEEVLTELFNSGRPPVTIFVDETNASPSDTLGFVNLEDVYDDLESVEQFYSNYTDKLEIVAEIDNIPDHMFIHISPLIFDTKTTRKIFSEEFTFLCFSLVSDSANLDENECEFSIKTSRRIIESKYSYSIDYEEQDLTTLYTLVDKIVKTASSHSSVSHWKQAVAAYCDEFEEIPSYNTEIIHYHGFLLEESAKEELEHIQDTVEELFQLTRTIGEAFSDASTSLTSEIQKVTVAVIVAIITNFVLILRYSDFAVLFPFTIVAISAILIFYFPIVQNQINRTEEMMNSHSEDFEMYLEKLRSHVGDRVFDLEEIVEQQETYERIAARALQSSRLFLGRMYLLLLVSMLVTIMYAAILTGILPDQLIMRVSNLGITTSLGENGTTVQVTQIVATMPALWICLKLIDHKIYGSPELDESGLETDIDTGNPYYFDTHPYIITVLLIPVIIIGLYSVISFLG